MNRRHRPTRAVRFEQLDTPTLQAARRLHEQQRFDEALERFDLALRAEPDNLLAILSAARAHGVLHRRAHAVSLLDRLERQAPHHPEVPLHVGETYRLMSLFDEAIAAFERAVRMNPTLPRVYLELAYLYEHVHRLEEASDAVQRLLRIDPRSPGARIVQARIARRRQQYGEAEAALREVAESPHLDHRLTAEAWGGIAQLYDDRGEYAAAWDAIGRCKQLQAPHAHGSRVAAEHAQRRFQRLHDDLNAAALDRWRSETFDDQPRRVALMTSFPRSGTTLLEQVLTGSPSLVSTEERNIFTANILPCLGHGKPDDFPLAQMLEETTSERLREMRERYVDYVEQCQRAPLGERCHLDKNPAMTPMIPAVLRVFPEMRWLIPLRDPRDVVLSCYLRYLPLSPMSVHFLSLAETVAKYVRDMQAWLRMRSMLSDGWLEVRYEEVVSDLEAQARRAYAFLDLPWSDDAVRFSDRAKARAVTSPSYAEVTSAVHRRAVARWRNYEPYVAPHLAELEPILRAFQYE